MVWRRLCANSLSVHYSNELEKYVSRGCSKKERRAVCFNLGIVLFMFPFSAKQRATATPSGGHTTGAP